MRLLSVLFPVLLMTAGCLSRPTPDDCRQSSPPGIWSSEPRKALVPPGVHTFCGKGSDRLEWFSARSGNETIATIVKHLDQDNNKDLTLVTPIPTLKKVDLWGKKLDSSSGNWTYRHKNGGTVQVIVHQQAGNALEKPYFSYATIQYVEPSQRAAR